MTTSTDTSAIKVLLVEDDEDDAIITQALLEQNSGQRFKTEWVRSFDAGLTRLKEHDHDIGLLDFNLGAKTGIDFLQEAHFDRQHAPIIMLTGQGNESLVLQALQSGAIDYIPKRQISSELLQRAICHGIEKIRLQTELTVHHQWENPDKALKQRTNEIHCFYQHLATELKLPLTAASELVNILLEGIPGPLNPEQIDYLQLIQGCCGRLDRNINALHEISQLATGKLRLSQRSEDLSPLIVDALHDLSPKAQDKNLTLQTCLAPHLPYVLMDVPRIRQVLLNLIDNAVKFTEKGGTILVQAYEDSLCPGRVRVGIQDTGIGIPQDQLNGIFKSLYQVEQDSSATARGLGLGLFICRELVRLHEGTMSVTSTLGQGSTFSFTLRCAG